jgi:acetate kinase
MKILVLNAGSSSQKCNLFEIGNETPSSPPTPLWEGNIGWSGRGTGRLRVRNSAGATFEEKFRARSEVVALRLMLRQLWSGRTAALQDPGEIDVVGHRIVYGGRDFYKPTRINAAVIRKLRGLAEIAPLHNRVEVEGISTVAALLGKIPQVAVFDTAFHHGLPLPAAVYPGPYKWFQQGIRRYGFHGINHQYCAERAAKLLGRERSKLRLITCHLGNGCSLAAIAGGRSVDTTMGFTPLDGLMMGTRAGSLDPGILTYLIRTQGYSAKQLDHLLNHECGLLGVSGISNDMREVLAGRRRGNTRARLTFDIFIHRLRAGIASMLASLGAVDALIFTAGIGENSPDVRAAACEAFEFLGLKLDRRRNRRITPDGEIGANGSSVRVLVIRAQEDWAVAKACWALATARQEQPVNAPQVTRNILNTKAQLP